VSAISSLPRPAPPVLGEFDLATVSAINLDDYPVLPDVNPALKAVYESGLARGNNPHAFSKLGDSMTANPYFLIPFANDSVGTYDLGRYNDLREVIAQFAGYPARAKNWEQDSFATTGFAAARGFNVAGPLDPTWTDPAWCAADESPLACEYRVARPAFAVIMFGTNDVIFTEAAAYDFYLRTILVETLGRDIVPILNTFPTRPEDPGKSRLLNQIVVRAAADYGIPLVNLSRALEPLANQGVDPDDTLHLHTPPDKRTGILTDEYLQYGFNLRNLITLQALDAVWRAVR